MKLVVRVERARCPGSLCPTNLPGDEYGLCVCCGRLVGTLGPDGTAMSHEWDRPVVVEVTG